MCRRHSEAQLLNSTPGPTTKKTKEQKEKSEKAEKASTVQQNIEDILKNKAHTLDMKIKELTDSATLSMDENVFIENTFSGTSTNAEGKFNFSFKDTGTFNLLVEFLGFEDYSIEIQLTGNSVTQTISLNEKFNQLKAVTITAGTYGTGKSEEAIVMSSLDVVTTAGSMGDINAAMRSLPGTSNNGDFNHTSQRFTFHPPLISPQ